MSVNIQLVGLDALKVHLERVRGAYEASPRQVVMAVGKILKEAMEHEAPERTGALRRGIHYRTEGSGLQARARFYDDMDYTEFVIHGTKAHPIQAVNKQALWWEGADHPVFSVQHPGTEPNPFPDRALTSIQPEVQAILEETGLAIVRGEIPL